MELAVRRFARNILLIHLGLLALVLAMVFFASRAIRESAREQALRQAQSRQELLATQTAHGVEGFYQSILSDLDLLPPTETSADERALVSSLTSFSRPAVAARQAARQGSANGQRRTPIKLPITTRRGLLGPLLARQLEERADYLFLYKKDQNAAIDVSKDEEGTPQTAPADSPEGRIVTAFSSFLKDVNAPAISPFQMVDGRGINLVCHPLPQVKDVVVAVVSVERINDEYLKPLNSDPSRGGAFLVNNDLMTMAASRPDLVGLDLSNKPDPEFHDALEHFRDADYQGWQVLEHRFAVGSESFGPAVVTAVPIEVPGKRWFVLVDSPLADVDSVVSSLFHRIVGWAIFVVVAMSGILVSTAVQMIRSRVKLERVQHEVLTRELEHARQIQQAWLPRAAPASRWLDIAAVNYPAQHISGDFYNWFDLPDGRTAVVIGDVTGHGMSAAFLMATTQLLVRSTMERMEDPGKCLAEVNRLLCTQAFNGQFVTMQLLVIDPSRRTVELATAGHPAPLLAEAVSNGQPAPADNGTAANLPAMKTAPAEAANAMSLKPLKLEPQLVLGVEADTTYDTEHFTLPVGATLLLYTDGAADVQAPDGRRFGNDGLRRSLCSTPHRNGEPHPPERAADARALLERVVGAVNDFRGTGALGDDLTLVAVRIAGTPRPAPAQKRAATMAMP